ncbi:MAG: thioredoxin family protein [Bacteroidota bacterium]
MNVMTKEEQVLDVIRWSMQHAMDYPVYRSLVHDLALNGGTTGPEQTESLIQYTFLNDKRMSRWDKTLKFDEKALLDVQNYGVETTFLVLTESWCGDASPSLPVLNKMAEISQNISLKIVLRDENPELMDLFLTNDSRSIPKLIVLQNDTVIGDWGPRSTKATAMVNAFKEEHGKLTPEFKQDLQVWYNKDKGQDIFSDILGLLGLK